MWSIFKVPANDLYIFLTAVSHIGPLIVSHLGTKEVQTHFVSAVRTPQAIRLFPGRVPSLQNLEYDGWD